jgi:hypothetical protein
MGLANLTNIPAPFKGWNTVDSPSEMGPEFAYVLDNLIPTPTNVKLRNGYTVHATSVGIGNVDTLIELKASGVSKMIAASSGNIYDVTSETDAMLLKSGFSSNQWQNNIFGGVVGLVNGVDLPQTYDGTSVSDMSVSGPADVSQLKGVHTFKRRSYFFEDNSQDFWYSALNTLGGTLTVFPLSKVGNFGGNLIAIQTVTKDSGDGQDDIICFFMSTGEVISYQGTDPSTDFVLIGVFHTGRPITSRAIQSIGADIISVTNQGYNAISQLLPLSYGKNDNNINKYIRGAAVEAASQYYNAFGWQVLTSPPHGLLIINVPQTNNMFVQHVLDANTMGWCRFTGINSRCWCVFGNDLYFGGINGTIYKYTGFTDEGSPIEATYRTPFLTLAKGQYRTTAFRPNVRFDAPLLVTIRSSFDFRDLSIPYTLSFSNTGSAWGVPWGSPWARSVGKIPYLNLGGFCYQVSVNLNFSSSASFYFTRTDFLFKRTGRV